MNKFHYEVASKNIITNKKQLKIEFHPSSNLRLRRELTQIIQAQKY